VVQTDAANRNPRYPNTIDAAVSTRGRSVPSHVRLEPTAQNGLPSASFVKCEQILTIDKARLAGRMGRVTPDELDRVENALRAVLAL
jgi:mRNA interferase MazF